MLLLKHGSNAMECLDENVDFFFGVVYCEGGANSAGYFVAVHDRLSAMVAGANSYAQFVEQSTNVVRVGVADKERDDRCFVRCDAEDADAVNLLQLLSGVVGKHFFVCRNVFYAALVHEVDSRFES